MQSENAIGQWITETRARKLAADLRLAAIGTRLAPTQTKEQITATVNTMSDLMQALHHAATEDKLQIYAGLNL